MTSHEIERQSFKWGTFGKNGDEPMRLIILRDIHDDHLVNIIVMLRNNPMFYHDSTLRIMLTEQEYRKANRIRVPFKFG